MKPFRYRKTGTQSPRSRLLCLACGLVWTAWASAQSPPDRTSLAQAPLLQPANAAERLHTPAGTEFPIPGERGTFPAAGERRRADPYPSFRLQSDFPSELILPAPTDQAIDKENRFIPTTIDPELPLKLVLGRPKVLQLADTPTRIYTPSETIIRTETIDQRSGREVAVTGLQPGTTTLIFWFRDPTAPSGESTVAYEVRVYADPLFARPTVDLQEELNTTFPNSYIELNEIADRLIVRGQVPDTNEMSQILNILLGTRASQPPADQEVQLQSTTTNLNFATAAERLEAQRDADFERRLFDPVALAQAGIINQLKVVGEQQVMLKVTVAEVNRSAARSIGLNFGVNNDSGLTVFQSLTGNLAQAAGNAGQSSSNILASLDMGQVQLAIEALRRMNLSRTLAEPNLVAMNGQPAEFQAGGQFPIPVISSGGTGNNLQGVSFVPFGVQLQFTPVIQDRDVIRLQMNAEVSTRDESLGTSIGGGGGGTQVAGLNSRNFSTTVQLRSGQTIAVAGLLQTNYGASTERVPFWGDLPFIGATGGVNRSSSGEQELVILVTPHLVAPVDACQPLPLPGDDVFEPSDIEFYIANRLESRRSRDHRSSVRTDYARQKRAEHCCPELFMLGDVGPTDRCCPRPAPVPHTAIGTSRNGMPTPPVFSTAPTEPLGSVESIGQGGAEGNSAFGNTNQRGHDVK
ncbi:Type II secretion system protein D precursor [Rosistilla ulvae]|uniref:Type II secretion system protein D n=1 Tax=Rosistilla ulvae TaxID=1930277 RepID=A0A517M2L9_9BACT|nr:pilus assembly protein N-terminal domain-containing protein [Rosistilla ulvae]QDS89116.1 Type II secretion system protein D precursor [Rosistilla ulvae]